MGACISKTESSESSDAVQTDGLRESLRESSESSDAVQTDGLRAEFDMMFRNFCRRAPWFSPHTPPALYLKPAYSNSPSTLVLVLHYFKYNVYAPLFYLELVKLLVEDDDDDDRKSMTMLAPEPELADGSPFGDMSAAQLLEEIPEKLELLWNELTMRKSELEKELTSIRRRWWLCMTDGERESQLESQKDMIDAMLREYLRKIGSLLENLKKIGSLLENLKKIGSLLENLKKERVALRAVEQMQAADHLKREADEKKRMRRRRRSKRRSRTFARRWIKSKAR